MKSVDKLISSLQQNITQNNKTSIVYNSIINQKILFLLQIHGFIDGFSISDELQIIVIFVL